MAAIRKIEKEDSELILGEEKYRLLIESVKDYAIILLNPKGCIVSWNIGAQRIKGYKEKEILGKHFSVFYPKEAIAEGYPEYELKKARELGRFEDEGWRIKKNGTRFWANVIITPVYNKEKKIIAYSKVTRDLSVRQKAHEELRQSEEKFRLLVEGVKDYAIFMLTPEGKVASWNEGAKKLKGYTEKEILGKHFSIFYTKESKDKGFPNFELEEAIKKGRFEDEGWRVKKDGTLFYANVVITALYNKEKKLIGFSKITRDLSERRVFEEYLKNSEEKYRLLISAVKDYAIFMLDPEGHIASWNEGAKRLKGYSEKEILGKHFSIFYPKDVVKKGFPEYELEQAKKVGKFQDEGWRIRKDGTAFFANVLITALYNDQKKLIGFSKITRDLTERKEAEEKLNNAYNDLEKRVNQRTKELSKSVKELKKINTDLDNFIYTASHDLKAPVSNIEGLILTLESALKENNIQNNEIDLLIEMVNTSIKRFQRTIKDLTEINQTQKNEKEVLVKIDLPEILEEITQSISHLVKESKADIKLHLKKTPDFLFSKRHINSIIYNLLTNAIKYRSPGRKLKIDIYSYVSNDYYIIEIKDNGLGIKADQKEKIFEMFKRLHGHVEGSGIGLYIVKRIVDNAEGKIEVDSKEGKGSDFRIYLPMN